MKPSGAQLRGKTLGIFLDEMSYYGQFFNVFKMTKFCGGWVVIFGVPCTSTPPGTHWVIDVLNQDFVGFLPEIFWISKFWILSWHMELQASHWVIWGTIHVEGEEYTTDYASLQLANLEMRKQKTFKRFWFLFDRLIISVFWDFMICLENSLYLFRKQSWILMNSILNVK